MSTPQRIQRKRTKGWRMPEGAVYVGRGTQWGNPYRVQLAPAWPRWAGSAPWIVVNGERIWHPQSGTKPIVGRAATDAASKERATAVAIDLYREALRIFAPNDDFWDALLGRDLACWCPLDQACHADVLLEIANRADPAVRAGGGLG